MPLVGLKNVVYAILDEATDVEGGTPTYQEPKSISGAVTANVNPNASNATFFADDGPYDAMSTIGQISLDLNVADLPLEVQAELLGHTLDENGILHRNSSDVPPWVAVGFKSLKSNGKYRYTWLNKGKFATPEQNNETKGESVSFQTPTITGTFVKRESDDEWERHTDEDATGYTADVGTNWLTDPLYTPVV